MYTLEYVHGITVETCSMTSYYSTIKELTRKSYLTSYVDRYRNNLNNFRCNNYLTVPISAVAFLLAKISNAAH